MTSLLLHTAYLKMEKPMHSFIHLLLFFYFDFIQWNNIEIKNNNRCIKLFISFSFLESRAKIEGSFRLF